MEELFLDYSGTLIWVSHDRAFLNNVVTSTIVLEGGNGEVNEYLGGYDDWLNQRGEVVQEARSKEKAVKEALPAAKPLARGPLSFKEQRELEALPVKIKKLEVEQEQVYDLLSDVNFYKKDAGEAARGKARLESVEDELLKVFERWKYLEGSGEKSL